jgi:GntR family transcriptional regulator/MocR family aminotransferase
MLVVMARTPIYVPIPFMGIDRSAPVPIERQVYASIRQAIRDGLLRSGARMPPTRAVAEELAVARNTVVHAYRRLVIEGYLRATAGGGTYVATQTHVIPEDGEITVKLSPFGVAVSGSRLDYTGNSFSPVAAAIDDFPHAKWSRLMNVMQHRAAGSATAGIDALLGLGSLREAIAEQVAPMRGIRCSPDQIVITSGREASLAIVFHLLADRQEPVLVEDPCDVAVRTMLEALQVKIVAGAVGLDGIDPNVLRDARPRLVYATPARQYPLGTPMSLGRRYMLMEWAKKLDIMIVEDEPYAGPFDKTKEGQSLKAIDTRGRVIHVGSLGASFSRMVNIGFVIAPRRLAMLIGQGRAVLGGAPPMPEQAALADFIRDGSFFTYLKSSARLHQERCDLLRGELLSQLAGPVRATTAAGIHLIAWLRPDLDDRAVAEAARRRGIIAPALSSYAIQSATAPALVLGFGSTQPAEIPGAVEVLSMALDTARAAASQ